MDTKQIKYEVIGKDLSIDVNLEDETVWLTQEQLSILFDKNKRTISEHINNIFREEELEKDSVVRKYRTTAADGKSYNVNHYNLDVIISVGYRVRSVRGTKFRIWATNILRNHIIENARRSTIGKAEEAKYSQLVKMIDMAASTASTVEINHDEAQGILKVLSDYAHALETLDNYDHQRIKELPSSDQEVNKLEIEEARQLINQWREVQEAGDLFGREKDDSLHSSLNTIYQSAFGHDVYPNIETKAANLLYFLIKNHSFTDGNKRIAAGLFAYFLDKNDKLLRPDGTKRMSNNALVAITLMVAESKSEEKDIMTNLITNLISDIN